MLSNSNQFIKSTKTWQQAWGDLLTSQENLVVGFATIAQPIAIGNDDSYNGIAPVETPVHVHNRLARLCREYRSLKDELEPDLRSIDMQIVSPAQQAKDAMSAMKKTIKTRENCKLDYERHQGRRDTAFKKQNRSERDNLALAKHESDLEVARDTYDRADEALRSVLPELLHAVYALVPVLLSTLVQSSNTLIANYYTTIHEFCQAEQFQTPPPPMSEVIKRWAESCRPSQSQIESLASCTNPKRGRLGGAGVVNHRAGSRVSDGSRSPGPSPSRDDAASTHSQEYVSRIPSTQFHQAAQATISPGLRPSPLPSPAEFLSPSMAASKPDYSARGRIPSTSSTISVATSVASVAAGKKKPPPPPPKRMGSTKPEIWVTALYDFGGQNQGDLRMKEGDRIKVLKKTESTNDWWEGELNGTKGSFPANYCQV